MFTHGVFRSGHREPGGVDALLLNFRDKIPGPFDHSHQSLPCHLGAATEIAGSRLEKQFSIGDQSADIVQHALAGKLALVTRGKIGKMTLHT